MTFSQKNITFALILLLIFTAIGIAEEQVEENPLLAEMRVLKEQIAHIENTLAQLSARLEQIPDPPRTTSDSGIDIDPEKHRLEIERQLAHHEIGIEAEKRKLELEQELAYSQAEQQRNIITFSAEQEAETNKFQYEMDQGVQEREYEMKREVEKARLEQEQEVVERDIERNLIIETTQIEQHQKVQAAVEQANIEKYTAIHLAERDAELERYRKDLEITQEIQEMKEEMVALETEHRKKMATLTKLVVFPLKYTKASEIADVIEPFLSPHAVASVNDTDNTLAIRDVEDCVKDVEMIVERLDVRKE